MERRKSICGISEQEFFGFCLALALLRRQSTDCLLLAVVGPGWDLCKVIEPLQVLQIHGERSMVAENRSLSVR
jgi:hypothetical protein